MPQPQSIFFSLPLEIRLKIYRLAEIKTRKGRSRGVMAQYKISIGVLDDPKDRIMAPALLRTCKQINHEALPILYSENVFMVDRPRRFLKWLQQIGPANIKLLKTLRIFPFAIYDSTGDGYFSQPADANYSGPLWCKLLDKLADGATGLKYVYVYLDADEDLGYSGAGKDSNFLRALGRMKVSGRMELGGFFAEEWPGYLEEKLGMPVWDALNHSEDDLELLEEYQQGEGLSRFWDEL